MCILDNTSQAVGIGRTKGALERHVFVRGRDQRASERERERIATEWPLIGWANATLYLRKRSGNGVRGRRRKERMEEDEKDEEGLGERVCVVNDSVSRDTKRQVSFPSIVGSFSSTVGLFFLSVLAVLDVQNF